MVTPPLRHIKWRRAFRIIASRYPPIDLFENLATDPAAIDALVALEQLTNPRIRDAVGDIALVPPEERVTGPGASWVMAAFTHINRAGSRFSDGSYGVYYAGDSLNVALRETAYHFARIAAESDDGPRQEDMRVLVGRVDTQLHDITALPANIAAPIMAADNYQASQALAVHLHEDGSPGVHYESVRASGGKCTGIFRANLVGIPTQERHVRFDYDGTSVRRYFDYGEDEWESLLPI